MSFRHLLVLPLLAASLGAGASCASDPPPEVLDESPGGFLPSGDPSLTGSSAGSRQGIVTLDDGSSCAVEVSAAEQRPLAMYIMLDSSGSMAEPTGSGASKWDQVQGAIRNFVAEAGNADISLGLQFFPLIKAGSQFVCETNEDCGVEGGPCFLSTCSTGTQIQVCVNDDECPGATNRCVPFGLCANSPAGSPPLACIMGRPCAGELGDCIDFERTCTNATHCTAATYAAPAVEIAPIASQRDVIYNTLGRRVLEGLTPTGPALQGAVDHAGQWGKQHPEQSVVAVLATDGLPTDCEPVEIRPVSNIAYNATLGNATLGTPPIRTFVIGVFATGDAESRDNLKRIALGGGSGDAFFVDTSGDVNEQFLQALREVRNATLACNFKIPNTGAMLDYFRVNLEFNNGTAAEQLFFVNDASGCATVKNGWHYDVDPRLGAPTAIEVCPDVCNRFEETRQGDVRVQLGCATIIR